MFIDPLLARKSCSSDAPQITTISESSTASSRRSQVPVRMRDGLQRWVDSCNWMSYNIDQSDRFRRKRSSACTIIILLSVSNHIGGWNGAWEDSSNNRSHLDSPEYVHRVFYISYFLEQSPFSTTAPVVKKVLVLCPASLVSNWVQEFKKWLGDERIRVFAFDKGKDIKDFNVGRVYHVIVCGYEKVWSISVFLSDWWIDENVSR